MSSGLRLRRVGLSRFSLLVCSLCLLVAVVQPVAATTHPAPGGQVEPAAVGDGPGEFAQQTANGTDPNETDDTESDADESDSDQSGIVGTITGLIGGVLGAIGGVLGAIVWFFLDNIIGQAIIGLTLGILIGLKLLAIYIERYEE